MVDYRTGEDLTDEQKAILGTGLCLLVGLQKDALLAGAARGPRLLGACAAINHSDRWTSIFLKI